jgi:hypothetical protein
MLLSENSDNGFLVNYPFPEVQTFHHRNLLPFQNAKADFERTTRCLDLGDACYNCRQ